MYYVVMFLPRYTLLPWYIILTSRKLSPRALYWLQDLLFVCFIAIFHPSSAFVSCLLYMIHTGAILRLVHVIAHNLLRTLASFAFLLHHIRINQSHHTLSLVSWPVSSPLLYRAIHAIHKILYINTSQEDHRWYRMQNVIFPHTQRL
jgi:hypothetical protein